MPARRVFGLVSLAGLLALGGAVHDDLAYGAQSLFAPAYDTVTRSSLRNLATALQSYALMEGDLSRLTVAELAAWGWEPGDTTRVTIWVAGDEFRVIAQDVRPGATAYEATGGADVGVQLSLADEAPAETVAPGVQIAQAGR